jgi:hypothetical protein
VISVGAVPLVFLFPRNFSYNFFGVGFLIAHGSTANSNGDCVVVLVWWLQSLRDNEGLYLASKLDEQLLIYIPFMQVVKLHSALFKGPEEEGEICNSLFEFCVLRLDLCPVGEYYFPKIDAIVIATKYPFV